ncbi:MAG: DNA gyrase subunit A [Ruminococcus sp.]|uniref:DNA gyrase subunit A n=1 Tax=Ruminococcus sp. TaxID=41978 RepID=UPI002710028F|nr:DNA gyrase subunit A [uncultured Ruminococcus sp.]MBQ1353861.1 DNA gyrase subunit A [Ruminococcus sp.]MDO4893161.1 DNA gyrase subunit A [Eubacteriales bacterium]MBQ1586830.1 DNA gyrase subunit A [Ruminococcus sp.]MBQ2442514.1 DNA gyrase subunit A [Ruminococcus sp.]MBQ4172239.1 DNA gyrase subunit A [Ruminococcus sp.]
MSNEQQMNENRIIDVDLQNEMRQSFLDYSMSVIVARALPDVRDGLKPVHRRILYTMFERGLDPSKPYHKCADTVGSVLGAYHPHGDASVYDAMVRLAQDFSMRYMLVDGHGNFGSVDGDPPAAYRYTEARMSKISMEMLTDIEKDTVDFVPNYDDRLKEPVVLPSRFPNLLVNGSSGIAVGMATEIPPHNLGETIDAACAYIENPDIELAELMECLPGPDFPTGGIIMGRSGIRAAYATGKGKITVRARTEIVEAKNGRFKIIVTELPYKVNKARLIENIANLVKDKRIEGISNIEDHSDRIGMHIEIDVKRDASPQIVLNQLFSYTQLQVTFGAIMLAIVDGQPKILTLKDMLKCYIEFQEDVIRRRTEFDLKKAQDRMHILEGLKIAIDFIDEVIRIIRASKDQPSARAALMERFGLDEIQAQAIVQMRLGQLTNMERHKIEEEIEGLKAKIADFLEILASETRKLEIVKEELIAIRNKYADPRRTEICAISGEVDIEDLIPQEECVLTLTQFGYVKRLAVDTYKIQRRGGRGVSGMSRREEDVATEMFIINSHDYVLFFTDKGRVYRLKCYEVPEGSRQSKGINIANLLPISPEEKVTSMIRVHEFDEEKYLVMVTRRGIIKRIALNAYNTARKGGLIALELNEGDELAWVRMTDGNANVIVATRMGAAIRFNENDVRQMGRQARGVKALTLKEGDEVIGMSVVREGGLVLTVSETGYGRLSNPEDYRIQSRGGKGLINYHVERYGMVAAIKVVDLDDDIIIISQDGIIIRIAADSIRVCSRPSKGVTVMKMGEGDKVVTVARAPHEEGETDEVADDSSADESAEDTAEPAEETNE